MHPSEPFLPACSSYAIPLNPLCQRPAREWLGGTAMPVTEIAAAFGYKDPANFTRAFRNSTGVAPTRFRSRDC